MKYVAAMLLAMTLTAYAQWDGANHRVPLVVRRTPPEYTEEARQARIEGEVVLRADVGVDGIPRNIRVIKPLGHGLDKKAIECVRDEYRFQPASKLDGTPIAMRTNITIEFRLADSRKPPPAKLD